MHVDQRAIPNDQGLVCFDKTDAAHIGRQRINMINPASGLQAGIPTAKVKNLEFVRGSRFVFGVLYVYASNPVTAIDQGASKMVADKATGARYQNFDLFFHSYVLLFEIEITSAD